MNNDFGLTLSQIRKSKGITQEELAYDICTRKYLSNIENGRQTPTVLKLEQLSNKLGVDLSSIYHLSLYSNPYDTKKKIEHMDELFKHRKFLELRKLIIECEHSNDFQIPINQQLIVLYKAMNAYELDQNLAESKSLLEQAFAVTNKTNILEIKCDRQLTYIDSRILISYSKILIENNHLEDGLKLLTTIEECLLKTYLGNSDSRGEILLKAMFNKAFLLNEKSEYDTALVSIEEGIDKSIIQNNLTLLSNFYYLKGVIKFNTKVLDEAESLFNMFLSLRLALKDTKYFKVMKEFIEESYGFHYDFHIK